MNENQKICLNCNNNYIGRKRIFCCIPCDHEYKNKLIIKKIKSGGASAESIKNYLLKTTGCVCSVCKHSKWNDKDIPIELEHIDGNSENNTLENCCLICPNCHAQTPTYKAKNKGNGRHSRRIRYHEGKSF